MSENPLFAGSAAVRDRILVPKQAAGVLSLQPRTVIRLAAAGVIPAIKLGKLWRFDEGHLREWAKTRSRANIKAATAAPSQLGRQAVRP
jgi:excisionase family DNA binding protein